MTKRIWLRRIVVTVALLAACGTNAGPNIEPGDLALRHDIRTLADRGLISGPVSTWPLAWGPILEDLRDVDELSLSPVVAQALNRVRDRARWETRVGELTFDTSVALADAPVGIRGFQNTPRGDAQVSAGVSYTEGWFALDLNAQYVDSPQDEEEARLDNSVVAVVAGNWSIAASTQERWWGPGWDGSLILGNNARPFPALVIDRVFTDAFETRWLSWLGPWDLNVMFGELERDRVIPNAQFFGMRFNFRPIPSLEIGISRSAQWCGDGRPCGADVFVDLFLGRDNLGDAGIGVQNEPGNQLAGFDARWATTVFGQPMAFYGQLIGEDEAGGLPSRYMGQFGAEWTGFLFDRWSTRLFGEFAGTSCQFQESSELFNCAYNHFIYETGYRYRQRGIGHGADNDARLISLGLVMVDAADTQFRGVLRHGALNRGGPPDDRHSLTPTRQEVSSLDISHSRVFRYGVVDLGAGVERIEDDVTATTSTDTRIYLQWRSSF